MKILLLSDTHGYVDDVILKHCSNADEVWHAGDFGTVNVSEKISNIKPLKGVYGNIDGQDLRKIHPAECCFESGGLKVFMIHIGGYPGAWPKPVQQRIDLYKPDIFVCGHSHILKITRDPKNSNMICINPGAAGKSGFHQVRTMVRMTIESGKVILMDVIELGKK